MAGSRGNQYYIDVWTYLVFVDNPLPGHNVISLKLNQKQQQEYVQNSEGESVARNVQLETIFEMNYNTGQWRKLQVKRPIP